MLLLKNWNNCCRFDGNYWQSIGLVIEILIGPYNFLESVSFHLYTIWYIGDFNETSGKRSNWRRT